jgi:hypothetical protein
MLEMDKRKRSRTILTGLLAMALLFALGWYAKNYIVRESLRRVLIAESGLDIELGRIRYSLLASEVEIFDMRIMNPPEYEQGEAIVIDRIFIKGDIRSLFGGGRTEIERCEVEIGMLNIAGTPGRNSNIDILVERAEDEQDRLEAERELARISAEPEERDADPAQRPVAAPDAEDDLYIRSLEIALGRVRLQDESGAVNEFIVDRRLSFTDVTDLDEVTEQLLIAILMSSGPELLEALGEML